MRIEVTEADIIAAETLDGAIVDICPVAQAATRIVGMPMQAILDDEFGGDGWIIRDRKSQSYIWELPPKEIAVIEDWDDGLGMEPHVFDAEPLSIHAIGVDDG